MADANHKSQVTTLFDNDLLSRVERLRMNSSRRFTNRSRGEHLAGKGGSSTEFADYRDYVAGDDVRFVDWNIFSRLNRPYMKIFHHEEELHVVLIVDASASMEFEGKLVVARQLAAAFGIMGLLNYERVSCWPLHGRPDAQSFLPACTGRASMGKLLSYLEQIRGGGDQPIEEGIEEVLKRHRGRGVAVLLSDFLTFGDLSRAMNRLFSAGLEIFGVQILGPTEIDPEVPADSRLVDCESTATLDVTAAGDLIGLYQEHRIAYQARLEALCRRRTGRFVSLDASADLHWILFDLLRRRGWVR
jgi:uncharacterized protein (DUF58 family)